MGMPSGLALSSRAPAERNAAAAACVAAVFKNSLLEITGMDTSSSRFFTRYWLEFPSAAAFRADILVGRIGVNNLHVGAIPIEFLSPTSGNISEKQSLGDQARKLEVSTGLDFASLAGIEPFAFVDRRPWKCFWRLFVAIHLRFGNELWVGAIKCAENLAAISDEKEPFAIFFAISLEGMVFFQFLGARRLQATVIPGEFHGRHVTAGREIVVDERGQRKRFFVALAGARFHTRWRLQLQDAKNSVETVRTHVAESATTEVAPSAPNKGQVSVVERTFRRRAEPQVPIQTFWHGFGFLWAFETLRPERTVRPVHDFAHRPDGAVPNPFTEQAGGFRRLVTNCDLSCHASFASDFGKAPRLIDRVRQRLLAKDVFALLHGRRGDGRMQVVGGAHNHGVEVLLLLKQLAEIIVGRAATILAGALLRGVIGVHDCPTRFTAGYTARDAERMGQLNRLVGAEPIPAAVDAEQFADRIAEFMRVPLRVIRAHPIGIADCHALYVGFSQKVEHDAQTLVANDDESNGDLGSGRNMPDASQHPARNDRKTNRRRGSLP